VALDRFLIAPFNTGLQRDLRPWLIMDDAFSTLENAYVFRGRVRKRPGSSFMNTSGPTGLQQLSSRLRINIGTVASHTIPGGATQLQLGQAFSVGNDIFTIWQLGAGVTTYSTNAGATATIDSTANPNTVTFTGEPNGSTVWYYPSLPVMGFVTYDSDRVTDEPLFAFDTQFSYMWDATNLWWARVGTAIWTGTNLDYFWGCTWRGITNYNYYLFVTNNNCSTTVANPVDYIKYYNGTDFYNLNPVLNQTSRLVTGLMVQPFKDRLNVYNVWESTSGSGVSQGTTNGTTGNVTIATITPFNGNPYMVGDNFLIGTTLFTVTSIAAGAQTLMPTYQTASSPQATGTFDASTGALVITGNGSNLNAPVYYISNGTPSAYNQYWNRLRFSQNGNPVPSNPAYPTATNAWIDTIPGLGGYIDAPTKEAIVSGEYIKDRWIVYFESSTWEQVYTFNQVLPFVWQKINTELDAVSTFSTVPFDKIVVGIGDVGIHACNGSNVERIDNLIPDEIFNTSRENGENQRVCGIRDYYAEVIYWGYQTQKRYTGFNNKVLAYNYKNQSWATFDDAFTAFGAFYNSTNITWASETTPWEQLQQQWNAGQLQQQFRQVLAGNQQGFVFLIERDQPNNAPSLQITNISINATGQTYFTVTSYNHCLDTDQFIYFENCTGMTNINNTVYLVGQVLDANTFLCFVRNGLSPVSGAYLGGGTIRRVSRINILTKQYNFYIKDGRNAYINKVDFQVDKQSLGDPAITKGVTVDYFISTAEQSSLSTGRATGTLSGTGVLETSPYLPSPYASQTQQPLEYQQEQIWHPIYPYADGEFIQLNVYMSYEQMYNISVAWADFQLHSLLFYTQPSSSRLQ
jgi:hypothetical protein